MSLDDEPANPQSSLSLGLMVVGGGDLVIKEILVLWQLAFCYAIGLLFVGRHCGHLKLSSSFQYSTLHAEYTHTHMHTLFTMQAWHASFCVGRLQTWPASNAHTPSGSSSSPVPLAHTLKCGLSIRCFSCPAGSLPLLGLRYSEAD